MSSLVSESRCADAATRVAILYPSDPASSAAGGIASFIRGVLKWAPPDIAYTLIGATSDPQARPVGSAVTVRLGRHETTHVPIVSVDPAGARKRLPLTLRYMWALRSYARTRGLHDFDVLDFHRVEPVSLFVHDRRPKNVFMHQDMDILRNPSSDIRWRHAPWLYEAVERRLITHVARVFCVRQTAVQRYSSTYPALAERFAFIPTWMDAETFVPVEALRESRDTLRDSVLAELGVQGRARLLISVGRLDRQKDPLLLIEGFRLALRQVSDLHLVIVGDGILRGKVTAACSSGDLRGRVSILGARPASDIARFLRASELFVMSSAYEGMPIAVLEALATGTPVVTTDVGEVRRVVHEGLNGYVLPSRTAEALASSICRSLQNIDALHGAPCTRAVEPFHPERVLQRIYDNHRREKQRWAA